MTGPELERSSAHVDMAELEMQDYILCLFDDLSQICEIRHSKLLNLADAKRSAEDLRPFPSSSK